MKGRRLVLLSAIVVAIIIGGWIIQQLRLESREQPVTEADLRILQRADVLLKDPASWNHYDDRLCDDDEATGKRSLFCALKKADTEELGSYEHRNIALPEVRFAIEDATRDRRNKMILDALRHFRLPQAKPTGGRGPKATTSRSSSCTLRSRHSGISTASSGAR